MEDMLRIVEIVDSKQALSFLSNSQVGMLDFVDPHKMVVRRSAFFSPFKCMELNWKAGYKVKGLKHKFLQTKGNLDL
jgi:hypothetical protein